MALRRSFSTSIRRALLPAALLLLGARLLSADPAPPDFRELPCLDYGGYVFAASSELEGHRSNPLGRYGMHCIFDGDSYTGWSEGVDGPGVGELLWVRVAQGTDTLALRNGFARTDALFRQNNRIRRLGVSIWSAVLPEARVTELGPVYTISRVSADVLLEVKDTASLQVLSVRFDWAAISAETELREAAYPRHAEDRRIPARMERVDYLLRLEILDVYPGTRWDDTCLTELRAYPEEFAATAVYAEDGVLRYDTAWATGRALFATRGSVHEPVELSPDGRWCLAVEVPAETEGRPHTSFELFRIPHPALQLTEELFEVRSRGTIPVGFAIREEGLVLVFEDETTIPLQ